MDGVDMVYHLAANSNVRESSADARDTLGTTKAVLNAMVQCNVGDLVFASSSAAYGRSDRPLTENDRLNPISEYGRAKAASEEMILNVCEEHGMNGTILRLANVVGPGQSHGVVFDLFNKLKDDPKRLEIMGNGLQTKEYVHVHDVLDAIDILMNEEPDIYNVSSGSPISVLEIADMICAAMGLDDVEYITEDNECGWEGDIPRYSLDTSKIRSTGWSPKYDSEKAIADAVSFLMCN